MVLEGIRLERDRNDDGCRREGIREAFTEFPLRGGDGRPLSVRNGWRRSVMRQVGDTLVWLAMIGVVAAVVYFTPRLASYVGTVSDHGRSATHRARSFTSSRRRPLSSCVRRSRSAVDTSAREMTGSTAIAIDLDGRDSCCDGSHLVSHRARRARPASTRDFPIPSISSSGTRSRRPSA